MLTYNGPCRFANVGSRRRVPGAFANPSGSSRQRFPPACANNRDKRHAHPTCKVECMGRLRSSREKVAKPKSFRRPRSRWWADRRRSGTAGMRFFNRTIHPLTHCEAHLPSAKDNDEAYVWEERVFALDHIRKKNGRFSHSIAFYKPQQPLEDVAGF